MRWTQIAVMLGAAIVCSPVQAVPAGELKENYQSIIERNPFGLKPPAAPVTNNVDQAKEKTKTEIFLTGITSIGFPKLPKQVYFYTKEQGKKDPIYYALSEGESKDGIRVMNIDPQQRKVRINMNNAETVLSFETHGVPVANVPVKGTLPVPGQPGMQPGVQPLPMPHNPNVPAAQPMYDPNGQHQQTAQPLNTGYQTAANPNFRRIPSRPIRGGRVPGNDFIATPGVPGAGGVGAQPQEQQPDLAEQYLRMHLNRAAQERETGIPMPPLPTLQ